MNLRKKLKHGSYSVVITAIFITAMVLLNIAFGLLFGNLNLRFDLTEDRIFSIEKSTHDYLAALDDTISFYFFNTEERFTGRGFEYLQTFEIAQRFTEANRSFKINFVDRLANPAIPAKFGGNLTDFCIVIESERTGRFQVIQEQDYRIFEFFFMGEQISHEYALFIEEFVRPPEPVQWTVSAGAERAFLSAIMSVSDLTPVRIAFTRGFGEEGFEPMRSLLELNGYITEEIEMFTATGIDSEIDFVVIFFPAYDYNSNARNALTDWLDNGGMYGKTLIYVPSPEFPQTPNLDTLTEEWGLRAEQGFIRQSDADYAFDNNGNMQLVRMTGEMFADNTEGRHLLTWFTRPVTRLFESRGGFVTTSLIETYEGSFFNPFVFNEEIENQSPTLEILNVAAMSSKSRPEGAELLTSRLIICGSFYLFHDEPLQMPQLANADFLLNIFSDISGRSGIASEARIIPKSFHATMFEITVGQANMLALVFVLIIPLLIITAGLVVFFRRRYR